MKQGLTYQLTERKGAADGHSEAVPLSGAFNHIDILEDVDLFSAEISSTYPDSPLNITLFWRLCPINLLTALLIVY